MKSKEVPFAYPQPKMVITINLLEFQDLIKRRIQILKLRAETLKEKEQKKRDVTRTNNPSPASYKMEDSF
jgi:hypothetical protein